MSFSRLRESFRSSNKDFSGPSQDVLDAWIEEEEEEEREFREEVNCQDGSVLFHEEDSHFSEYNYSLSSGYKKNSKANKKKDEKTDTVQPDDVSQCSTLTTDLDDHGIDDVIDEIFPIEEQEQEQEPVKEHVPVTPKFPSSAEKRVLVIQQETSAVQPEQAVPQEEKEPVAPKLTNHSERTVRTRRRSEARKKAALSALSERSERLDHRRRESIRKATSLRNLAVEKEPKGLWWTSIVKTVGSVFQKKNESKDELKDLEQQFHSSCPTLGESFISDFVSEEEPWMMNQPPTPKSSKRRISFQWRQGAQSSLAEF